MEILCLDCNVEIPVLRMYIFCKTLPLLELSQGYMGLLRRFSHKESACQCWILRFDLGWGRSPGEGNGNPLQYFRLGNPTDREAWRASVHVVAKGRTQLSDYNNHSNSMG